MEFRKFISTYVINELTEIILWQLFCRQYERQMDGAEGRQEGQECGYRIFSFMLYIIPKANIKKENFSLTYVVLEQKCENISVSTSWS